MHQEREAPQGRNHTIWVYSLTRMRRPPRAVSVLVLLSTIVLLVAIVWAQDLKGPVNKATSPDQWEKDFDDANKGKYEETDAISGPMYQILNELPAAVKDLSGNACRRAAASRVWDVVQNAANGALPAAFLASIKSAMSNILSLGESEVIDFVKEKGKDALKDLIKEKLKKQKPEMYKTTVSRGGCTVKLIAIWDKAAGTYEVYVYGDCNCTAQPYGDGRTEKLKTFAAKFTGSARIQYDSGSQAVVVNVGHPKVQLEANCGPCRTNTSSTTSVPPTQTTTSIPPTQPPPTGGTTGTGPCAVAKPCPECMPIYDAIQKTCKRLEEIPDEQKQLAGQLGGATSRLNAAKSSGNAADIKEAQKDIDDINKQSKKLIEQEQGLTKHRDDLMKQLGDCTAKKCGTGTLVQPKETPNIPKWVYVTPVVPAILIGAGGGGDKTTTSVLVPPTISSTTTVTPTTTTTAITSSTTSTSTTVASTTTTSVPQTTVTGTWNVTSCRTTDDASNHETFIALCRALVQLGLTEGNLTLTITGTPPFVTVTGSFTATGDFNGTGRGTVAGNANVGVAAQGSFTIGSNGQGSGRLMYTMGTGGELPTGRSVTYEIIVSKASPF